MAFPEQWGSETEFGNTHLYNRYDQVVSTAVLRDGWIVTAWRDVTTNTIKAQVANADGSLYGEAFNISEPGEAGKDRPSIAAMPDGRFVVVYSKINQQQKTHTVVQETFDVFTGKLDSNPIYSTPLVNSNIEFHPAIYSNSDGSFHITYNQSGIKYFKYSNGVASTGTIDPEVTAINIAETSTSQGNLINLQYTGKDKTLYLLITKSDGILQSRIPLRTNTIEETAKLSSVITLSDGNFAVVYADYDSQTKYGSFKLITLSPQGSILETKELAKVYGGFSSKPTITPLLNGGLAFSYMDTTSSGGIHIGTYKNGVIEHKQLSFDYAASTQIKTLNDGRFIVEWVLNFGPNAGAIKARIYDPRESAIDWTGSDIGQQYAGTKLGDHMRGGASDDTLFGGVGNDILEGGSGSDRLDGGDGWDMVSYLGIPEDKGGVTVDLTTNQNAGNAAGDVLTNIEVVQGTNSGDILTGIDRGNGNGVELYGMGGIDTLTGKGGGDRLYGGAGDDILFGGGGADLLDGGDNWDMVTYLATPASEGGIVLDMTTGATGGAATGDTLKDIEVVQGTNAGDIITGVDKGNGNGVELYGMGGKDTLTGKGGGDRLYGGTGDDVLKGGGGSDQLDGGADNDTAVFSGNQQAYTITRNADGTYTVTGLDGTDLLKDVEYAKFDDRTVSLADMSTSQNPNTLSFDNNTTVKTVEDDDQIPILGTLKATDPDDTADKLTFSIDQSDTNKGRFMIRDGNQLAVAYGILDAGTYTVKVKVSDPHGGSLVKDFTITSTHVNVAPVVDKVEAAGSGTAGSGDDAGKILVNENTGTHTIARVTAHDTDGGTVKYELKTNPEGIFAINETTGLITMNGPEVSADTIFNLRVAVTDGQGGATEQVVSIKVKNVNKAPVIDNLSNAQVDEGSDVGAAIGTFAAHDQDDGPTGLKFELKDDQGNAADANGLFAVDATGHLTVAKKLPVAEGNQTFTITLKVSDKDGGAGSLATYQTFTITVADVVNGNHAPNNLKLNGATELRIKENDPFTGTLSAQDQDNDASLGWSFDNTVAGHANDRFEIVTNATTGQKQLKLKAPLDYETLPLNADGSKSVMVYLKANDGKPGGTSATQAFKISVENVDETPTNQGPSAPVLSGNTAAEYATAGTLVGTLAATDPNGDSLSYSLTNTAEGRFKIAGNQILVADGFRLDFEQAKAHNVTVQVSDGKGGLSTQTFAINVGDVTREVTAGSTANDVFKGGALADRLAGGLGNDKLWGGLGNDQLTGGKGKDTFVFDTKLNKSKNKDLIKDYSVKDDTIWLDNALFKANKALYAATKKGTEKKPLKMASKFFSLDTAKDKDDFFVYDSHKRVLYYDADGSGSKAGVAIATFTNNKDLKNFSYKELLFV
ncbi:calcium-binding protein [Microvirga rosea]|uniref:calcium-binding protein n=1 Tax=Microvirga rosea TaxID=2715425 RepID=UPI001D0B6CF3|nr:calcium-binding protein [Microvirga rosea]MCB8819158.1 cadherin domain-containing protein [Microvirga rosea]